jgi:hypothetical protein
MKPGLEAQLKNRFPELMVLSSDDYTICDCGTGWYSLIEGLCLQLEAIEDKPEDQHIISIRSKKGLLVPHIASVTHTSFQAGLYVQTGSRVTCEMCGAESEIRQKHHPDSAEIYNRCDNCHAHHR